MADQGKSLFDRAKEALGMGADGDEGHHHDHDHHEHDEHHDHDDHTARIDTEGADEEASPHRDEPIGGVSGAPEAAGWAGPSGGMGASGAMGGAGAGGPIGATDPTVEGGEANSAAVDGSEATTGVAPGAARTEYEMGHEVDPAMEPIAESGPRGGSEPDEHPSVVEDEDR